MTEPLTLAQRLRDQGTLPVCPYDKRSPDYRTAPNDKPCPMCGGEPEGPDKCTGADLRIMSEAADDLDAKDATIASLRDANKALTAENERLQSEWYEYRQFSIDYAVERDRTTAAEAKLAKVEAERDAALKLANFAYDKGVQSVSAELAEARKERDRYKNGLQTLATTFYKEDQHQDYAKHVLASKEVSHE